MLGGEAVREMVKIPKEVVDMMSKNETSKVLATADADGVPNAAAIWSLRVVGEDQIAFAEVAMKKTKENLLRTKRASVLVISPPTKSFQLKGDFLGFQTSGPVFDGFAKAMAAMKMTVHAVGMIKINEVYEFPPRA